MENEVPVGPFETLNLPEGIQAPWYILPFDKAGVCTAPLTRANLMERVQRGGYTDIYLFAHGWNNDWAAADGRYQAFLRGYQQMRADRHLPAPPQYKPLLVGVLWPSTSLVLPWEEAPDFAPGGVVREDNVRIQMLADEIAPEARERLLRFAAKQTSLDSAEAHALAELLLPLYAAPDADLSETSVVPDADGIINQWRVASDAAPRQPAPEDDGEGGFIADSPLPAAPEAAALPFFLDPRTIVRLASVYWMKNRAGTVGTYGVGPLLSELQAACPGAHFHLIGHSFGAKVLLSALCTLDPGASVHSLLLLQPAVSRWCFAHRLDTGQPGGYHQVLNRVEQPILTTFTEQDFPLRKAFPLAVRRAADYGELRIAGGADSRFAALGGYGPGGCDDVLKVLPIPSPPDSYSLQPYSTAPRILALNGTGTITGHGDINMPATWWALYNQVMQ